MTILVKIDYRARMDEMLQTNADLTKHSQYLEQEQLQLKENLVVLRDHIEIYRRAIKPAVLVKLEANMDNKGVAGVPGGAPPDGAADASGTEKAASSNPLSGIMSKCTIM
jgi:hypothetical protein